VDEEEAAIGVDELRKSAAELTNLGTDQQMKSVE